MTPPRRALLKLFFNLNHDGDIAKAGVCGQATVVRREIMTFKNIFITGASSGIGRELCFKYAAPGVTLGMLSNSNSGGLEETASSCRAKGAVVVTYLADVSDTAAMRRCIAEYITAAGHADLVIANAGVRHEEAEDYSDTEKSWRLMEVDVLGVMNTISPFVSLMKSRKAGPLAVVSSISAFRGTQNSGIYSASKAAVNIWMESMRLRLIPYSVKVTVLCPGFVKTAMTEGLTFWQPGSLSADRAAEIIQEGIARGKRTCVFPWQSRLIWGTFKLMPGELYDFLITFLKKNPVRK
jgi:short-subunit dehydrogenase